MNISYRKYNPSDKEIVFKLVQAFYNEDEDLHQISNEQINKTLDTLNEKPDHGVVMVIEIEKEIIGYAILINYWSNSEGGNILALDEIYIKKEHRSKGIGTDFIKYVIKNKLNNSVGLQLEVTESNDKARKLYEKLGFKDYPNSMMILNF